MSNFTRSSINPATGNYEIAEWLDNHYGPNRYGVRFQDGKIYPEEEVGMMELEESGSASKQKD